MRKNPIFVMALALALGATTAQAVDVLVFAGNVSQAEFPALSDFNTIEGITFDRDQTADRSLPGLAGVDILWIGQGELCENAYFLEAAAEQAILDFVEAGGICISVGQDSDGGRPCETGWFPGEMTGVERGGVEQFQITNEAAVGDMFTVPNEVTGAHHDDTWSDMGDGFVHLATINNGADISVSLFDHGQGTYIVSGIENEGAGDVAINLPLMENMMLYAARLIETQDVEARGKATVTWAAVKTDR